MAKAQLKNIHRLIKEAAKEVPAAESFAADLALATQKMHAKHQRSPSKSYKPSSMVCVRNMYFQVIGATMDPEYTSAELIGIMESGSTRHEAIQAVIASMKEFKIDCEYIDVGEYIKEKQLTHLEVVSKVGFETKLYHKNLNISFMCDGILLYKGKYYILEIKTESIHKFAAREAVEPLHIPQASTYALCIEINNIMFVYECRDNTAKKVYEVEITDSGKFDILSKIETSDSFVKKMVPPPMPPDIPKKICSYCRYKAECRKAGKN